MPELFAPSAPPTDAGALGAGGYAAPGYAGFWLRLAAYLLDSLIVAVIAVLTGVLLGCVLGIVLGVVLGMQGDQPDPQQWAPIFERAGNVLGVIIGWLYWSLMESSSRQATLGKMALGLYVTDTSGRPIGFGRATGRHFAKILSALTLMIGFIMAGFTDRKQALHDMVANTLVLRRPR